MTLQESSPKKRPFLAFPDTEAYYPAATIVQARSTVFRSLDRGEGVSLVFGECGVGKTLLFRLLADEFELDAPVLRLSGFPFSDRKSFLAQILFELRADSVGNEQDIRLRILDYFRRTDYRRFFFLIDDAGRLPLFALDELCSFLDLTAGRSAQVRIALFGSHRLEERLNHPKLARFCQRIVCRAWLEPFTRRETCDYIDRRTESCAAPPFSPEAKARIHQLADGVPRLINQIADLALWFGPIHGQIDQATIEKSWETLQQIPPTEEKTPAAQSPATAADTSPTVEFGSLDDDEPTPESHDSAKTTDDETIADEMDQAEHDKIGRDEIGQQQPNAESAETPETSEKNDEMEEFQPQRLDQIDTELDRRLRERLLGESLNTTNRAKAFESPSSFTSSVPFETPSFETPAPFKTPTPPPRSDHRAGYLEELRLLELEVSQEAALIRKIREMQTGMESFRTPKDDTAHRRTDFETETGSESMPFGNPAADLAQNEPLINEKTDTDSAHSIRPPFGKAPYRPEKPKRSFTSTFERLYADEKHKNDHPEQS